jgi:hypothetical protein
MDAYTNRRGDERWIGAGFDLDVVDKVLLRYGGLAARCLGESLVQFERQAGRDVDTDL